MTLVGARADRGYSVAASEVLVALGGSASLLDGVVPERVSATIDVSNLDSGTHEVPVGFEAPAGLNLVSLSPARLQVVVSLPASPPGDRLHWERRAVLA